MSDTCPFCASTDVFDLADSDRRGCLDCDKTWMPKVRRLVNNIVRNKRKKKL